MSCCCDDVCVFERRRDHTGRDETADMCHVNQEVRSAEVCYLPHSLVINQSTVRGGSSNEDFGPIHESVFFQGFVIDEACLEVDAVGERFEVC